MKSFYPDIYVENIGCITASMLIKMGMEAVVLDVDNTLVTHNAPNPTAEAESFLQDMKDCGIKICVVSNNCRERVTSFCERINIEYCVWDALKPRRYGYDMACRIMGVEMCRIAAIGDQLFTDVWGANRAGCVSVLVEPIDITSENIFIRFKRLIEKPFINKIRKGGTK